MFNDPTRYPGHPFPGSPAKPAIVRDRSSARNRLFNLPETAPEPESDREKQAFALLKQMAYFLATTNFTVALPTHNEPHFWSRPIDLSNTVTIAAAVSPTWTTIVEYEVQDGSAARISGYGVTAESGYTYDGSILFRIVVDDAPVGLSNWAEQRGSVVQPRETFINLPKVGQTVKFQARRAVLAASPTDVTAALVGWTYRPLRRMDGPANSTPQ
jgi:hypothetical protein